MDVNIDKISFMRPLVITLLSLLAGSAHADAFFKLVAHPHYVVILVQDTETVTAIEVLHTARQYP